MLFVTMIYVYISIIYIYVLPHVLLHVYTPYKMHFNSYYVYTHHRLVCCHLLCLLTIYKGHSSKTSLNIYRLTNIYQYTYTNLH